MPIEGLLTLKNWNLTMVVSSNVHIALGGYAMRTYNYSPMLRHSVGFDRMHRLLEATNRREEITYPPYNIETDGEDAYRISVAVSGFSDKDLDITLEKEELSIVGKKEPVEGEVSYLHRGIAGRSFNLKFNLADHVKAVNANLENGVLVVDLEREVPEELKPRKITIETHPIKDLANKAKKMISGEKIAA
jgi:molecular chaperone IbpA